MAHPQSTHDGDPASDDKDEGERDHRGHHAEMVRDFRRRFVVSLAATLPILALSPMIRRWLGLVDRLGFGGDTMVLLALSTFVYGYGGWPFLTGLVDELRERTPGMMTLVAFAISVAYVYSAAVALGALALADIIREESRKALQTLHDLEIDVVMLTGDNERVARWVWPTRWASTA